MRKVAVYARVSTEHEAQLSALENQVQYYDEKLKAHPEWDLYEKYIDEGKTGTSIHKRKNFMRMLEDAKKGYFDLIVTREVSRFARNTVDTLQVTRDLKRIGVEVFFTEDNIWTFKDDDGELKLTIMATLAQNESKKISQRVKAGQKISFLNGTFYGTGNILGYDRVEKKMIINHEQAKIVKFIFEQFLKGEGTTKIKHELERKGIPTATGLTKWNAATITRILQNPFYCGRIVYRKSYIPDYLEHKAKKNNGDVEKVEVQGTHEPIISVEDFDKVQKIINNNSKHLYNRASYNKTTSIWSKKLICSCGSTFNRRVYHRDNDNVTYCYQCYNQKNNGSKRYRLKNNLDTKNACDVGIIPEWKLELVANSVFSLLVADRKKLLGYIDQLLDANIEDNNDESLDELNELKSKLSSTQNKLNKLLDMHLSELISRESFITKQNELNKAISDIKTKIEALNVNKQEESDITIKLEMLKKSIRSTLNNDDNCISEEIIDGLFQKVVVHENWFVFKLNTGLKSDEEAIITKLVITKDDVKEYERKHSKYKRLRIKEPIIACIAI